MFKIKKAWKKRLKSQDFEGLGLNFWNTTINTAPSIIIAILIFCEIVRPSNSNGLSSRNNSIKNREIPERMNIKLNVQPGFARIFPIFLDLRQKRKRIRHETAPAADEYNCVGWMGRHRYLPVVTSIFC